MVISTIVLAASMLAQESAGTSKPEVPLLDARLGGECSADFTVKDADGKPVYAALVHVRVRYGFWNIKRADLEVGTNADGRARLENLPNKARRLLYDIRKNGRMATAEQDVSDNCHGTFDVLLR